MKAQSLPPQGETFALFDKLNADTGHFRSSNDICTPMGCVKEMVDALDVAEPGFWRRKDLQILDSCSGNGNFHGYIQYKTPLANLHFNEINEERLRNARRIFGEEIHWAQEDFLTFGSVGSRYFGKKFDLVVSNPPYARFRGGKRVSKNHNMSRAFIRKALEVVKDGGYVLFIAPDNWMSFSDRNILPSLMSRHQFHRLNIHGAKKWFPKVGSSFTWFLLEKSPNRESFLVENHYKLRDRRRVKLDEGVACIPLYYSETARGLMRKTVWSDRPKYAVEVSCDMHKTSKKEWIATQPDEAHRWRLVHTPKQTVWSRRPHKYQNGWKVFLSLSDKYRVLVDECGMTQSMAFVRCRDRAEAERVREELDQPLYRAINNLTRYGNFNNVRVLQRLPRREYVSLTEEERELVECFAGGG